jgi:dTDP-4-amino-4,6-dideoxygalactose transaminase
MVVTASADTDARLRLLRQHGMSVPDTVRHASAQVVFEAYSTLGFNYRLTDIQAAIGREQLARLDGFVARRREMAARYATVLAGVPGIVAPREPEWARTNWQTYAVRLETANQRQVMQRMLDDGVSTRRGVMNAHREGAYPAGTWRAPGPLTRSECAQDTVVALPLFHEMTVEDQDRVVESLTRAVAAGL